MSENENTEDMVNTNELNEDLEISEDDWAAAMAEQCTIEDSCDCHTSEEPENKVFPRTQKDKMSNKEKIINSIPVRLSVELGETDLTIEEISQLGKGSVVKLYELAGKELKVKANGVLVAKGEVAAVS